MDVGFCAVDDEAGPSEVGCEPQRAADALLEHALNHGGAGVVVGEVFAGEGSRHEVDDCVNIGGNLGEGTGDSSVFLLELAF